MHCISQNFKRISQFLNWNSLSNSYSFIHIIQIAWFSNSFPNSISEKSILSKISKTFSGFDFLRILSFQMTFQSISQVQIKMFLCFKILKFQNPKFSEIHLLRILVFLRIHFPFQKSFSNEFLEFLRILKSISSEKQSKSQNWFSKVQVFLSIHFPMQISDFQWTSMIFPGIQFSSTFSVVFQA